METLAIVPNKRQILNYLEWKFLLSPMHAIANPKTIRLGNNQTQPSLSGHLYIADTS